MNNWKERVQSWKEKIREASARASEQAKPYQQKALAWVREFSERAQLRERFLKVLPQDLAKSLPTSWDWRAVLEWSSVALQKQGAAFYTTLFALLISAFFLADIVSLWVESKLPDAGSSGRGMIGESSSTRILREDDFAPIWSRNLFSSKGLIPGESAPGPGGIDMGGAPQLTSLPLNLVGTLILRNELKSIATIEDKSASMVYPVRIEDEIPSKIRVLQIEPRRVTFLNLSSSRREYVELPEDTSGARVQLGRSTSTAGVQIERQGNNFNVPRLDLDRAFADLNNVLTQARAVPHYENGVPSGYKLFQVQPDGFFGKLGLKDQDIICGIDGQSVNDPSKALELLGQLKTANHVELCVKRDGRQQNFAYDIR